MLQIFSEEIMEFRKPCPVLFVYFYQALEVAHKASLEDLRK